MRDPFKALRGRASSPARPRATAYSRPHRTAPHRTAPHRTAPHRTAPHRTAPHRTDMLISDSPSDPATGPVREPGC
ncbi:hypothetical protein I3J14_15535 [Streptomyces sp. HB-N217]|uniref:hypothetical protein n=1 Tax=Streptomyces sp. HB-N217 TaxID=2792016 RepID=UPI0018D62624|nr:hypothetical protein [Streptomyces sp. HB-N217]MBH5131555.1 hypothetical protein [Streptomyces sp. HB-N217]